MARATAAAPFTLGIDFGSDSVRAVVVDTRSGDELATGVAAYPRWAAGRWCDPARQQFRQHPLDHLEAMTSAVRAACDALGRSGTARIAALGVDATGSSPLPVAADGSALALAKPFADDPDALCVLWKDHTAEAEAARINELAHGGRFTDCTRWSGGAYSPEWFWAKVAHIHRTSARVARAAHTWMEHCDWLPFTLAGGGDPALAARSRCAAGHKAMWHPAWGGLPDERFLVAVEPRLKGLRARLYTTTTTIDQAVGRLCPEWAQRLGLPTGLPIAGGALDAHMGAVGAGAAPGTLVKVMGTSTCDMLVAPRGALGRRAVPGICGQVDGSIIPGLVGLEAGQSAFGDIFAWYRRLLAWPLAGLPAARRAALTDGILPALEREAARLPPLGAGVVALDWFNGRRTPDLDPAARGVIAGLHLGHDAPAVYLALVESAAYGGRAIVEHLEASGVAVRRIAALGGIARKSPLVMQVSADVLGRPIQVVASDQCCARGSAMAAAVAAGLHRDLAAASRAMASPVANTWKPRPAAVRAYNDGYRRYCALGGR
ncbi:MAG: ribulokinase [Planctomycetes bacterium]|nr:ribulokinase [Planctomycetota bacterium]